MSIQGRYSFSRYDSIIVLGGGLVKKAADYKPTTYQDKDLSGMLGAHVRIHAAVQLLKAGASQTFVFTTGVTRCNKDQFSPDVPAEAPIYAREFGKLLPAEASPQIILEKHSVNTTGNLVECLKIINLHGWQRVAILSNDYHLPRVQALVQMLLSDVSSGMVLDYISAEAVLLSELPGMYDAEIITAYASALGRDRLANEAAGLTKIQQGAYALGEQVLLGT